MSKTKFLLLVIAVFGLAGLSLYVNRDWFSERPIHISHRVTPWAAKSPRSRRVAPPDPRQPVVFNLDPFCRFTRLEIFIAAEIETNKYARPVWDLTTGSNSIPVGSFMYGAHPRNETHGERRHRRSPATQCGLPPRGSDRGQAIAARFFHLAAAVISRAVGIRASAAGRVSHDGWLTLRVTFHASRGG